MKSRQEAQQGRRNREQAERRSASAQAREAAKRYHSERGQTLEAVYGSQGKAEADLRNVHAQISERQAIAPPNVLGYHGEHGQTREMAPSRVLDTPETRNVCGCPCHKGQTRSGVAFWRPDRGHSLDCKPANWPKVAADDGRDWYGWDSCSVENASLWRHGRSSPSSWCNSTTS